MNKKKLKIIYNQILNNSIKWGKGILRGSGRPAGWTIDMREEIFNPYYSNIIAELFMEWISIYQPDYVAGLETTGGFLASQIVLLSQIAGTPVKGLYIRKKPKINGLQRQIEGPLSEKSRVILLDDALNSGDAALEAITLLLEKKCEVIALLSILNFEYKGVEILKKLNIPHHYLFTISDLRLKASVEKKSEDLYTLFWSGCSISTGLYKDIPSSSPVIRKNRIFLGRDSGSFISLHTNGVLDWSFPSGAVFTNPIFNRNLIYFTSCDGFIYCLNISKGNLIWKSKIGDKTGLSSPVFSKDRERIFIGTMENDVPCLSSLDSDNGHILWNLPVKSMIESTPGIFKNNIIFGDNNGSLYSVNSGKIEWEIQTRGDIKSYIVVDEPQGLCYFASCDGYTYCVSALNGRLKWKRWLCHLNYTRPVISKNRLIISASSNYLYCLNKATGEILWHRCLGSAWSMPGYPVIFMDRIYIGSSSGEILVLDMEGNIIWSFQTGGSITSAPFVIPTIMHSDFDLSFFKEGIFNIYKDRIYISNMLGFIETYNFEFNQLLWSLKISHREIIPPHKSLLFCTSTDGYIYCFLELEKKI